MNLLVLLLVCFLNLQAEVAYPQKILMEAPATVETRLTSWSQTDDMGKPYSTLLGQKDVNNNASSFSSMKTISNPGRYYLTESLQINPKNTYVNCLKITCSNVVLDLRGHSITGSTSTGSGMIAISIDGMLSNIVICNGTISAINGKAIDMGLSCKNITIKDMTIENCNDTGIYFTASDGIIERVRIFNCTGSLGFGGAYGLYLTGASRVKIVDCKFDNNQSSNNNACGAYFSSGNSVDVIRCTAHNNAAGMGFFDCSVYGFYASSCTNLTFKDCSASTNTASTGTAHGFLINFSCNNTQFENCIANRNSASGAQAYGFMINGSHGCSLKNCVASNNTSDEHAYGFMAYQANNNSFINCQAIGQSSTSFAMSTTTAGFCCLGSTGNFFRDCIATGNVASSLSGSRAVGFYFSEIEQYSHIVSCIAQSNLGASGTAYGIYLDSAKWCTVKNNQLYANTGNTNGYGIRDSTASSMSMFVKNFAYGNGSSDGTIVNNYDVKPSPTDTANDFPVKIAYLTSFSGLDTANDYHNIELVEQVP